MSNQKKNSLIVNIAYKFGLTFFKMALPILIMPYVYRQISPVEMGVIGYVLTIMSYFYVIGDFGYYIYGFRETILLKSNPEKLNIFFNETFLVRTIMNSIALICYVFFIIAFKSSDIPTVFYCVAGIQILGTFFNVESFFEGIEKFRFITIKTIIIRVISVFFIFLYVKNYSDSSSLYYLLISSLFLFANNIVSFIFLLREKVFFFKKADKLNFLIHFKKMAFIFIMINAVMLFFQLDKLVIGINGDLVGLSFYALSEKVTILTTSLLFSVMTVMAPKLGESLLNNLEEYKLKLRKVLNTILLLLFPMAIFLISSSREVLFILGGDEYLASKQLFQLFSIYIIVYTLLEVIKTNIFILIRKEKIYFTVILFGGLFNLILKFMLKDILSVFNIMIITTLISFMILIVLLAYIHKELKLTVINSSNYLYLILPLPILLINFITIDSDFISLIVKAILAALYYITVLILMKDKIFKEIIKKIFNR